MQSRSPRVRMVVGRYELRDEIASGGMGTVHLGRLRGAAGFSRMVAIKRLNPLLAREPEFLQMFLDEARLAGRVRHPNVVPTFDVFESDGEALLVMEYVHGESFARLARMTQERGDRIEPTIASAVMSGVLYGLHAAHEATDEKGEPLGLVHRDVSPQNVLVGADGIARVVDFGVAKAAGRLQTTGDGRIKGKLSYMPPEQMNGRPIDRRVDVYAAGVVLWEALTGERLFAGENQANTIQLVLLGDVEPASKKVPGVSAALDAVIARALARDPTDRFSTAREMCAALIAACPPAAPHEVSQWVEGCAHDALARKAARVAELESDAEASPVSMQRGAEPEAGDATVIDPRSQVSSISVALPGTTEKSHRRRQTTLALVVAALLVVGGALAVARPWRKPSPVAAASASESAASTGVAVASQSVEPAGEVSSIPAPSASPSNAPPKTIVATPPKPYAPHPAATKKVPDCDPPYVRAPDGRKIWKRDCFGGAP